MYCSKDTDRNETRSAYHSELLLPFPCSTVSVPMRTGDNLNKGIVTAAFLRMPLVLPSSPLSAGGGLAGLSSTFLFLEFGPSGESLSNEAPCMYGYDIESLPFTCRPSTVSRNSTQEAGERIFNP